MTERNLNHDTILISQLESGTHDFLVKAGKKSQAMRIEKNAITATITLYNGQEVKNENRIGTLSLDYRREFNGIAWPLIQRKTIEHFSEIIEAREKILRADNEIARFILRQVF